MPGLERRPTPMPSMTRRSISLSRMGLYLSYRTTESRHSASNS
jgi:hypothetical protein